MKKVAKWTGLTVVAVVVIVNVVGRGMNAPRYSGPRSDHFDGEAFHNAEPVELPGVWRAVRYALTTTHGAWDVWRENPMATPPPARIGGGGVRVTFINHATTLIQMDSLNVLTDPIWSERASPFPWTGPQRRHAPGLALDELSSIEVVLLSHNHYDHTDLATLDSLRIAHNPLFIVGLGSAALLRDLGITHIQELDWDDETVYRGLRFIGQRCRHFSGRGISDSQPTLWMSYILDGPSGRVYFSGDTGYGSHFAETGRNWGPFRLAILPIGAFLPRWFMGTVHINPEEALQAHTELRAYTSLGVHYGTFRLSEESQDRPLEDLERAIVRRGGNVRFWTLAPGEGRDIPTLP